MPAVKGLARLKGSHMFFHALTFAGGPEEAVRVYKHRRRDPACVNAMKQTCVIVILYILPDFSINHSENFT